MTLNAGATNVGTVNSATFASCTSSLTTCQVTVQGTEFAWSIRGTHNGAGSGSVPIGTVAPDEVHLLFTFSNVPNQMCLLQPSGCTIEVRGSMVGTYAAATRELTFPNAGGLVTSASGCTFIGVGSFITHNATYQETPATAPNPVLE